MKKIMSNVVQAKSEMHSKTMLISNTVYYMRFYVLADMSTKIYCTVGDPLYMPRGNNACQGNLDYAVF